MKQLIKKYNVAAPRYTSYPTVPMWDTKNWSEEAWLQSVRGAYQEAPEQGLGVYVHLPFCESLCTYCGCNTRITKNHAVEDPYIESLVAEWQLYRAAISDGSLPRIAELHLGGGTPTFFAPHNLERLILALHGGSLPDGGSSYSFEAHPANTTFEHLQTLYDLGFRRLSLGIQDFDPKVQFVINRRQSESDVWRVMEQARAIGYESINFDLIYGLPLQTPTSVERTIDLALALHPDRISFYSYAHVPWMKPAQRRFTEADLPQGEEKLKLYMLGKEMIQAADYHDVGMDHFALEADVLFEASTDGTLHRNFMGYTDRHVPLLIGLGVSSISDSWFAFAQNVKTVEEYHALVSAGRFPLVKGHVLNEEDLILRKHILNVMCAGTTVLDDDRLSAAILQRLSPLVADRLISLFPEPEGSMRVLVTERGRSFLRNICMAFDQRLIRSAGGSPQFSQAV